MLLEENEVFSDSFCWKKVSATKSRGTWMSGEERGSSVFPTLRPTLIFELLNGKVSAQQLTNERWLAQMGIKIKHLFPPLLLPQVCDLFFFFFLSPPPSKIRENENGPREELR